MLSLRVVRSRSPFCRRRPPSASGAGGCAAWNCMPDPTSPTSPQVSPGGGARGALGMFAQFSLALVHRSSWFIVRFLALACQRFPIRGSHFAFVEVPLKTPRRVHTRPAVNLRPRYRPMLSPYNLPSLMHPTLATRLSK